MLEFRKVSAVFKSYDAAKADGCNTLAGAKKTWKQVAGDYSAEADGVRTGSAQHRPAPFRRRDSEQRELAIIDGRVAELLDPGATDDTVEAGDELGIRHPR